MVADRETGPGPHPSPEGLLDHLRCEEGPNIDPEAPMPVERRISGGDWGTWKHPLGQATPGA